MRKSQLHADGQFLQCVKPTPQLLRENAAVSGLEANSLKEITLAYKNENHTMSDDDDVDVTPQRRYDLCVYLRRYSRIPPMSEEGEAPCETSPGMFIEMAGPSIRNQGQATSMIHKVQAAVNPTMIEYRPGLQRHENEHIAPRSLLFVDAADVKNKRFLKELSVRIVVSCLHKGIRPLVEVPTEIRSMLRLLSARNPSYDNTVGFAYRSKRKDPRGAIGVVEEFVAGPLIEVWEGSECASELKENYEDESMMIPGMVVDSKHSCCSITESELNRSDSGPMASS